jgi:hypothetical protein
MMRHLTASEEQKNLSLESLEKKSLAGRKQEENI